VVPGGAIAADLEACISLVRANANAWGDVGGIRYHVSGLHHQQMGLNSDE
jgi:hypothetical protein